jgi:hypothetical protein
VSGRSVDAVLAAEAAARPTLHLAGFREEFAPDAPDAAAWLRANFAADMVHPTTPEARRRVAAVVTGAVADGCGI